MTARGETDADALARTLARLDADASPAAAAEFATLACAYIVGAARGDGAVSADLSAAELDRRFDDAPPAAGAPLADVIAHLQTEVVADANRLMHPMCMGHQVSPPLPAAIWSESLIAALNQSVAVSEMGPTATALEHRLIRWMCELVGFGAEAGGTLTSGGTEATFSALLAARAAVLPGAWANGVSGELPVVLCGEHAHYSVARAVAQLGLGARRAVSVRSDGFRMSPSALELALEEHAASGVPVMAVVATAASTATGAFDDLERIGRACETRGVWLHVDGAHGATALLSKHHRDKVRGIARAHSIAWDAHKMMLMPLPAGVLLVRDERLLDRAYAQSAPYLFHGDPGGRVRDQGVRSFMCSRRADAVKLWVALQRYGTDGFAALYDALAATARALWEEIAARGDFETAHEPETNILCFRWVGDRILDESALDRVNRELREAYNRSGVGWITATELSGRRWLRVTIMNPRTGVAHLRAMLDALARLAAAHVDSTVPARQR